MAEIKTKPTLVVYIMDYGPGQRALLSKLGKHTMGGSCLRFRTLADLDESVLEQLIVRSIEADWRNVQRDNT